MHGEKIIVYTSNVIVIKKGTQNISIRHACGERGETSKSGESNSRSTYYMNGEENEASLKSATLPKCRLLIVTRQFKNMSRNSFVGDEEKKKVLERMKGKRTLLWHGGGKKRVGSDFEPYGRKKRGVGVPGGGTRILMGTPWLWRGN